MFGIQTVKSWLRNKKYNSHRETTKREIKTLQDTVDNLKKLLNYDRCLDRKEGFLTGIFSFSFGEPEKHTIQILGKTITITKDRDWTRKTEATKVKK